MSALVLIGGAAFVGTAPVSAETVQVTEQAVAPPSGAYLSSKAVTKGASVTVYCGASSVGGYIYSYYYKKHSSDKWSTIKSQSTKTSVSFTPAAAVAYDVKVGATDSSGMISYKIMTLNVYSQITNKSTVSAGTVIKGKKVTLKGKASGGSGKNKFAYYYKKPNETIWRSILNYSASTSATFTPALVGEYELMVKVRNDAGGLAKKTFTLNVCDKLVNTTTLTPEVVKKGECVNISSSASGGTGDYQYSYSYKRKTDKSYTILLTYSYTDSVSVPMNTDEELIFLVKAKDSAGNIASKTFSVRPEMSELEGKAQSILNKIIDKDMTEFDKVKAIHDWLVRNVSYDVDGIKSGSVPESSYTAEGLFDTRKAVCDGYSKAFELMAGLAGLSACRVTGTANNGYSMEKHAWNQVKVDGEWYNIDVTWDDPTDGDTAGDNLSYEFFLIPDRIIDANHFASSVKNTCTAEQPVDLLIPILVDETRALGVSVSYCANESEFAAAISDVPVNVDSSYKFIYKTDISISECLEQIGANLPAGSYRCGISYKGWMLSGHYEFTIVIRVS